LNRRYLAGINDCESFAARPHQRWNKLRHWLARENGLFFFMHNIMKWQIPGGKAGTQQDEFAQAAAFRTHHGG
jgi:hypothetical protein